jgi:hypothetical protein
MKPEMEAAQQPSNIALWEIIRAQISVEMWREAAH